MTIILKPGKATLNQLETIYRDGESFELDVSVFDDVRNSAFRLAERIESNDTIYGVNTGFGKLASVRIDIDDLLALQYNLVRSHCAGVGNPLPENVVRLIIALKCLSL